MNSRNELWMMRLKHIQAVCFVLPLLQYYFFQLKIHGCFYCSSYSSFYTNPVTNPCCRVLALVLLKRPSRLDCPHCLLYWLSVFFTTGSVFYYLTPNPTLRGGVSSYYLQWSYGKSENSQFLTYNSAK